MTRFRIASGLYKTWVERMQSYMILHSQLTAMILLTKISLIFSCTAIFMRIKAWWMWLIAMLKSYSTVESIKEWNIIIINVVTAVRNNEIRGIRDAWTMDTLRRQGNELKFNEYGCAKYRPRFHSGFFSSSSLIFLYQAINTWITKHVCIIVFSSPV